MSTLPSSRVERVVPMDIDAQIAELQARAEAASERLRSLSGTASSPDGAVTVGVGPGGALTDLKFGERAYDQPPERLAAQVMALVTQAQQQVSGAVVETFSGVVGEDSAAMGVLTQYLPADPGAARDGEPRPRDGEDEGYYHDEL